MSSNIPNIEAEATPSNNNSNSPTKSNSMNVSVSKLNSATNIPRGGGSSAVKALRPNGQGEHGEENNILLQTLSDLKQLTQDSLRDLSGRMSLLERRVENAVSPTRKNNNTTTNDGMSNVPVTIPVPVTDALEKRIERKSKRNERKKEFKNFKNNSIQAKSIKGDLAEANGLCRDSINGPIMEFVHGSKLQGNISGVQIGDDIDISRSGGVMGSPSRPMEVRDGGNNSYTHNMHSHGGSNQFDYAGQSTGHGDKSLPLQLPPQQQYHNVPGTPGPTGLGQPPQPLRLNSAPFPTNAPTFSSPDWSRVDVWLRAGDLVSAYGEVLDRGSPTDFGRLLMEGGIHPYALSATLLNRVCDMVSLILLQGSGPYTETCLLFILSVLRDSRISGSSSNSSSNSVNVLLGRTKHALTEALLLLSSKANQLPSKQALLAGLLQTQLKKIC